MTLKIPNRQQFFMPRSMKYEEDGFYQASSTSGSWYTVTDYTGPGVLFQVGIYEEADVEKCRLRMTLSGLTAVTWQIDNYEGYIHSNVISDSYAAITGAWEFFAVKAEVRQDSGVAHDLAGQTHYGIFSEEKERRIIPAGDPLPDRDYTYPFDVMAVFFKSDLREEWSSKIEFLPNPGMKIFYAPDGTPLGNWKKALFGPAGIAGKDYAINQPRKVWIDDPRDGEIVVEINGQKYKAPVKGGVLVNKDLPKKNIPGIIDITE